MEATNKAHMDAMTVEWMNSLMTAHGGKPTHQPNKENQPPEGNVNQSLCPNCKTFILHKPELCFELEANKVTHNPGWIRFHCDPNYLTETGDNN
jgi:hypothetical protein